MAVHVVGAGALGSMIAARLSAAGVETRLVLRAKSGRWRAVDASSNRVRVLVDGAPHDVAAAPDARDAKLVLLCTKVWQARDALRQAKTSAKVVALCNGALSLADDATIVPAVTTHGCFETQPFDVTHAGPGTLWVSDEEAFKTLSASETLNVVRVSELEMTERLWKKLAVSCVLNPLTALHSCRNGDALPGREDTCRAVCAEIASLDDCPCTAADLEKAVYDAAAETAANYSSMYQDVAAGRRTEVDALSGWVVDRGNAPENARLAAISAAISISAEIALERLRDELRASAEGREVLALRPIVSTADADAARLRDACAPGTFGRAYGAFMGRHGFDADDRSPVTLVDDEELAYVLLRYRQVHDYWHVLFGLPPSIPGELALKWFELVHTGLPVAAFSAVFGPVHLGGGDRAFLRDAIIPWALDAGKRAKPLLAVHYEAHWHTDLAQLRADLRVVPAPRNLG